MIMRSKIKFTLGLVLVAVGCSVPDSRVQMIETENRVLRDLAEKLLKENKMLEEWITKFSDAHTVCYTDEALALMKEAIVEVKPETDAFEKEAPEMKTTALFDVLAEPYRGVAEGENPYLEHFRRMGRSRLVEAELERRGNRIADDLRQHMNDERFVFRGGGGRWETVGGICRRLLGYR